ncbi:hypothetical protein GGF50DRAFT_119948 [Schizophyllum commune]
MLRELNANCAVSTEAINTTQGGMSLTSSISSGMRSPPYEYHPRAPLTPMSTATRLPAIAHIGDPSAASQRAIARPATA